MEVNSTQAQIDSVKIESGIPIPVGLWRGVAMKMKIGDSAILSYREARCLMMAIERTGFKGVQRKTGAGQLQVWKTEKINIKKRKTI